MQANASAVFQPSPPRPAGRWDQEAVRIVEELFAQTPTEAWDDLLSLRQALQERRDWSSVLDIFLHCRFLWEHHAYLPFYRLRTMLAAALKLENQGSWAGFPLPPLELLLRKKCRSLSAWIRHLQREWFEMGRAPESIPGTLQVVELAS